MTSCVLRPSPWNERRVQCVVIQSRNRARTDCSGPLHTRGEGRNTASSHGHSVDGRVDEPVPTRGGWRRTPGPPFFGSLLRNATPFGSGRDGGLVGRLAVRGRPDHTKRSRRLAAETARRPNTCDMDAFRGVTPTPPVDERKPETKKIYESRSESPPQIVASPSTNATKHHFNPVRSRQTLEIRQKTGRLSSAGFRAFCL